MKSSLVFSSLAQRISRKEFNSFFKQARAQPVRITALVPRAGRRDELMVQDLGAAATTLNRDPATLRHITATGGPNQVVHLWLDAAGRLLKVEIPSRRLRVERLPPA